MRSLVLAVAIAGLPAQAMAQAGAASGASADQATATTADAPQTATDAPTQAPASPPTGVAAPGINVSETGDTHSGAAATSASPHRRSTTGATHAGAAQGGAAASGVAAPGIAAPGVSANGAQNASAPQRTTIEPANALERAFVGAALQESQRAAFRRIFLDAEVALATISADANAAPRLVRLGPAGEASLIFTSDARATQIMGARSPRQLMTGRQALQRLRGAHLVIININLDPYLTLDAAGVDAFLGADAAPAAQPRSAGPAQ